MVVGNLLHEMWYLLTLSEQESRPKGVHPVILKQRVGTFFTGVNKG